MAKIRADQLSRHIAKQLSPMYCIFGDEPLLKQEACDEIRNQAFQQGYTEREKYYSDASLDWNEVFASAANLSLFAERKFIEIHLHTSKISEQGAKMLLQYCQAPPEDTLLLITAPKLDASAQKTKWFKALENNGDTVQIWPITSEQLPDWINTRLRQKKLNASSEAIEMLAAKVEGNLLAAKQEIEKLVLLAAKDGLISTDLMAAAVGDSARYDVFGLVDKALSNKTEAALKTLQGLKSEGTEPIIILWALTREIRTLASISEAVNKGQPISQALKANRIWDKRAPLIQAALQRLSYKHLMHLLRKANGIDRAVKGLRKASPWDELTDLVLHLSGIITLPPSLDLIALQ